MGAPHEILYELDENAVAELTPMRSWATRGGQDFQGKLIALSPDDGIAVFRDMFGRPAHLPLRYFNDESQAELEKLLKPVREARELLDTMQRHSWRTEIGTVQVALPNESYVMGYQDGWVYLSVNRTFFRTPESFFDSETRARLQQEFKRRELLSTWKLLTLPYPMHAQLLGRYRDDLVMRGLVGNGAIVSYRVPMNLMFEEDAKEAMRRLEQMPNGGTLPKEMAPEWWYGLQVNSDVPVRPIAITEDSMQLAGPNQFELTSATRDDINAIKSFDSQIPIVNIPPEGLLFAKVYLEEKRILAENPGLSDSALQAKLASFRQDLMDTEPFRFLSPAKSFRWSDCAPFTATESHVIAELPDHFVFVHKNQDKPFWVLKSEVPESMRSYCSTTAKKMAEFYERHQDAKPNMESSFRLVRNYRGVPNAAIIAEPVNVARKDSIEVRVLFMTGNTNNVQLDWQFIHPVDALELKMVFEGKASGTEAPSMNLDQRSERQLLAELESLEAIWEGWQLRRGADEQVPTSFAAAVNRRYQDGFVFRTDGKEFLVDAEMLHPQFATRATKTVERLESLRSKLGKSRPVPPPPPKSRLWHATRQLPLIGQALEIEPGRSMKLVDLTGRTITVEFRALPRSTVVELLTQYEADQQVRLKKNELTSDELVELAQLKKQLRQRFSEQVLEIEIKNFGLKGTMRMASGSFEMFDGEDAILCDPNGRFLRIFQFALKEESLAEMKELERALKAKGKRSATEGLNPAEVKLRLIRGSEESVSHAIEPGEPIEFSNGNLYVMHSDGRPYRLAASTLNREDWSEIRSMLYLKANGMVRDTEIDARLKRPLKPGDMIESTPALSARWKDRLDEFAKPIQTTWTVEKSLDLKSDVRSISPDGRFVLTGVPSLQIIDTQNSQSVEIKSQAMELSHAFFANNNKLVIGYDGRTLKCWDSMTGQLIEDFRSVNKSPLASCQSADGKKVFYLANASQLLIFDAESNDIQSMQFAATSQLDLRPGLWCSSDGKQFVMRVPNGAQVFGWSEELKRYVPAYGFQLPPTNVLIAVNEISALIADPGVPYVSLVVKTGSAPGALTLSDIGTGLLPEWIGFVKINGVDSLQVIGKKTDPFSQSSPYMFSAYLGFDRKMSIQAQTIDSEIDTPVLISAMGTAAVTSFKGNCHVVRQPTLIKSRFEKLERIAESLVEANDIGQIEATWNYLRRTPFDTIGEFPDHSAELFLDFVHAYAGNYQWQHGGNLKERHELLVKRWNDTAPNSLIAPILVAMLERDLAWEARGTGFANTVKEAGLDTFQNKMRRIAELIKPILESEDPSTRAYSLAYEVAMSLSLSLDVTKKFNAQMMRTTARTSMSAHAAVVLLLLPRWHGNPGDSERYIKGIARSLGGDEGDRMYMMLMLHAAKFYSSREPASQYLDYEPDRVLKGLRVYYQRPQSAVLLKRALNMFAIEERWDLYKQALEMGAERRVYLDEIEVANLQARLDQQKAALEAD